MSDEKRSMLGNSLPIPTYEEATSSRAHSDVGDNPHSNEEASHLLASSYGRYRQPTVETARSSLESSFLEEFGDSARPSRESLERAMVAMEILEPGQEEEGQRRRGGEGGLRMHISKRISSITDSLSAISIPHHWRINPFRWFSCIRIPDLPCFGESFVPLYRFLGVIIGLILVYALLASDLVTLNPPPGAAGIIEFDINALKDFIRDSIDKDNIEHYLEYLSRFDHTAGTEGDLVLAKYVEGKFKSFGLEGVGLDEYNVYLNFPKPNGRKLSIIDPPWEAALEEPKTNGDHENTFAFHGHSKTGSATGPLIYANYGARADFDKLGSQGLNLTGSIVLVRYGGTQMDRALKIKAAELRGAAAVIEFSDPKTEGWDLPEGFVQRGSVSLMSFLVGDVLTPGTPSKPGYDRISLEQNPGLVGIPSLPLSWDNAKHLLQSLKGKGFKVEESWTGDTRGVEEWWTGSISDSPVVVKLENDQVEDERHPIWNVLGYIGGSDDHTKRIVVGNHRDAWCFGASDPNSGTAVMLEVARLFGKLLEMGWRPQRSVIFANWDAEEYNLIGSTEYVEDNIDDLRLHGMAYINLDVAVSGKEFRAAGSPLTQQPLLNVLERIQSPSGNGTLRGAWGDKILPGLGAGSDYVAFQDYAGVSSIDIGFAGDPFPYHSCYDTYEWMKNTGDPGFIHHLAIAQVLGVLIVELADTPILPFNMIDYAHALGRYTNDLEEYARKIMQEQSPDTKLLDFKDLRHAVESAEKRLKEFDEKHENWMDYVGTGLDTGGIISRQSRNARMSNFEEHLLDLSKGGGLPGREWFKHVVFAPETWSGYDAGYFPGVRDALANKDWELAQKQVEKIAKVIDRASYKLLN
ncbi:Zn-dependent exopeptidase [Choiromyces venosus 120613-1]|uniref:Zn-dependent exopeptidase n=1 Tax=Choiromyces venosus 120613-1 TaxID=1336337 RepID=A0A3N4J4C5_9PEZI|nr:Zn-dependent exopeptidase [Choiromyces venosus 120613-1]